MSNGQILVSAGDESDNGKFIIDRLPPWMPTDSASGNFKLLDAVGRSIDRMDGDLNEVDHASSVEEAESIQELRQLAKLVQLPQKDGESLEKYRTRLIAEYQIMTDEGTIGDILKNAATILDVDISRIEYKDLSRNGVFNLNIPGNSLDNRKITNSEFVDIINKHAAAGYRIEATLRGTFTYNSPSDYSGPSDSYDSTQLNSDATKGHDGLDTNDNPKDNGGTYAGLL